METVIKTSDMKTSAIFSEDGKHRYLLQKEWDAEKKKLGILMIMPGLAGTELNDLTTMLCENNAQKLGYGGINIVNLFSKIHSESADTPKNSFIAAYDENTDNYIEDTAENSDAFVIAYGSIVKNSKLAEIRAKLVVTELLGKHPEKLLCITDYLRRKFLHPLDPQIRSNWELIPCSTLFDFNTEPEVTNTETKEKKVPKASKNGSPKGKGTPIVVDAEELS